MKSHQLNCKNHKQNTNEAGSSTRISLTQISLRKQFHFQASDPVNDIPLNLEEFLDQPGALSGETNSKETLGVECVNKLET